MNDHFNYRLNAETRIRELESENRRNLEEKQRYEIDYKVIYERFNELKKNHEISESELYQMKNKQNDEMHGLKGKLEKMSSELEFIQRENNTLRMNEERLRTELSNLEKQRDSYRDKYQDYKGKNNVTSSKLMDVSLSLFNYYFRLKMS